uniref:Amino acid transporter transmembrane domain-containing protein n=1 Tax=Noctiluca scintillans TaxID=2966 RepID=A0A7S1AKW4_NOCSC|mmetsp:Transcript_50507/g.134307  ORF Transcript_50507/g.134307 Transcript_50507/m.134307 type:complete len:459 (+) Transcript_50507:43-1419(+)
MAEQSTPLLSPKTFAVGGSFASPNSCAVDYDEEPYSHPRQLPHVGGASLSTALSNLVLAVLGAGQLTLPYAFSQLGFGFGMVALMFCMLLSVHSLYTISVYELNYTRDPTFCIESYAELVVRVLGQPGKAVCTALMLIYSWGGGVSFLIVLKGELSYLWSLVFETPVESYCFIIVVSLVILWPLSALDDVSSLKRFSPLGCGAAVFITFVVLLCTPWTGFFQDQACEGPVGAAEDNGQILWWTTSLLDICAALPLLSFSMNSTWAYVPILCTLRGKVEGGKPTSRVYALIVGANAIIIGNYILLSSYGYTMFCENTNPNILVSLGAAVSPGTVQEIFVVLARTALSVQLTLALPMRFFVSRKTLASEMPLSKRVLTAFLLVGSATVVASLPISLATTIGIVSSICATMIIYILPAIVDLRIALPGMLRRTGSLVSLSFGVFVMIGGLVGNITNKSVGG